MRKGYIRTPEIRLKNSLALKGRKMTDLEKGKLKQGWSKRKAKGLGIPWNKGKKENRESVLKKLRARRHSSESKLKMSLAHKGRMAWNKGIPLALETKAKISIALKGRIGWNKGKKGLQVAWNKGFKGFNKGLPRTEKWRKNLSLSLTGPRNGSWCGGIARKKYPFDFNSTLKLEIRKRDSSLCQLCGLNKKKMDVHHIDYNKDNSSKENLILLCASCHIKTNAKKKREFYINFLKDKVQRL